MMKIYYEKDSVPQNQLFQYCTSGMVCKYFPGGRFIFVACYDIHTVRSLNEIKVNTVAGFTLTTEIP